MYQMSYDNILLDPVSVFIKIAIISYKPAGIKISVSENSINIEEDGPLQGIRRFINRNNREQISYLVKPIKRMLCIFPPSDKKMIYIYNRAIIGLKKLKESYTGDKSMASTASNSLDLYINLIENSLKGNEQSEQADVHVVKELENLWNMSDIDIIYLLMIKCEENGNNSDYINSIECLLKSKQKDIYKLISSIN